MITAGIGCRRGCEPEDVRAALAAALARAERAASEVRMLCAPVFKCGEPALAALARQLDKPLLWLASALLEAEAPRALTASAQVAAHVGLPSVSEAAALAGALALAGAGASVRLLGPRAVAGGATCALALLTDARST